MSAVELPTCSASPNRAAHHQRHWRILEGLSLFGGGPLAISAGEAWDVYALHGHGLVQVCASKGALQLVKLTDEGRRFLDARWTEEARELAADSEAKP